MRIAIRFVALTALLLGGCGGGGGGSSSAPAPAPSTFAYVDTTAYSLSAASSLPSAQEGAAVTHHTITLNGAALAYTATAGHLIAKNPQNGAQEASMFYVAYTLDNQAAGTRPVTFFYNGGPGSSSVWLHMGSFGPRRLITADPLVQSVNSFPEVDNAETLLDVSDLVFVDPPGTGLSEAIAPFFNQSFWGVDADANVVRDFIARYVEANNRAASPKFIFGESYGTTRSAVLANVLESSGISIKGVVLQSSILNYNVNCSLFVPKQVSCGGYVPTYGAIGAYHSRVTPAPTDLPAYVQQMRSLVATSYEPAVAAYINFRTPPSVALLAQMAASTGPSTTLWQNDFDLYPTTYQTGVVPGSITGWYDARYIVPTSSPLARGGDPSSAVIDGPFQVGINSYLASFLSYSTVTNYTPLNNSTASAWNFLHDGKSLPDVIPDLAAAIVLHPKLQVLSLNGYHDLSTPFYYTENDLARLGPNPNIQIKHYAGGHMTYLDDGSRALEKADLVRFYQAALAP